MTVEPWAGIVGVAGEGEDVPPERGLGEVDVVAPADDVAVDVRRPRVGGVDAGLVPVPRRLLLVSVAIAISVVGIGVDPLRPVHLRGADQRRRPPRVLIRMSASDQPASAGLSGVSGSHSPVPLASNRATYSVPSSSGLIALPERSCATGRRETKR